MFQLARVGSVPGWIIWLAGTGVVTARAGWIFCSVPLADQLKKQALAGQGKALSCPVVSQTGLSEPGWQEGLTEQLGSVALAAGLGLWLGLRGCKKRLWLRQDALSAQLGKVIQLAALGVRLSLAVDQLLILEQSNAELFEWLFFFF